MNASHFLELRKLGFKKVVKYASKHSRGAGRLQRKHLLFSILQVAGEYFRAWPVL